MKKIVLMMMAMMSMTVAFAGNNFGDENKDAKKAEATTVTEMSKYNMTMDYSKLARTLHLNENQMEGVIYVHDRFIRDMRKAGKADEDAREALVNKAVGREYANMKYILNREQFAKFRTIINSTIMNRGLVK